MSQLKTFDIISWHNEMSKGVQDAAIRELENGGVLYFPSLPFVLHADEQPYLSPSILDAKAKNISYNPRTDHLGGTNLEGHTYNGLKEMMKRYSTTSHRFLCSLLPDYRAHLTNGKTSYRPVEIKGRQTSLLKDDTRLHIDAFPSNPTRGQRILRIFTNINPAGQPRVWRVGEPMEDVLKRFLPNLSAPIWGMSALLKLLKVTKARRTAFDHYMLGIHDSMKRNEEYQRTVSQEEIAFPPGSSWIVYTDQVSHAAMSGQYVLEQTFHISADGLKNPHTSPLRVMEKLLQKTLA